MIYKDKEVKCLMSYQGYVNFFATFITMKSPEREIILPESE